MESEGNSDWISALAKQATIESTLENASLSASKKERIERRNAKKKRRRLRDRDIASVSNDCGKDSVRKNQRAQLSKGMTRRSEFFLERLATQMHSFVAAEKQHPRHQIRPYQCPESVKRGKATSNKRKWSDESIQPRKRDYGGLGIARPSLWIELQDVSFVPKLSEEFAQHIPGFFGKQRTKAMKRQLDGNMLWRRIAEKRTNNLKLDGKKVSDMTPDERVEAMINAGML